MIVFRKLVDAVDYIEKQIREIYKSKFNEVGHIVHKLVFEHYTFLFYEDVTRNKSLRKLLLESEFGKLEEMRKKKLYLDTPIDYVLILTKTYNVYISIWKYDYLIAKYVIVQIRFFKCGDMWTHVDDFYFVYLKQLV